ncbi:hypothetical protein ACJJTC_007578 [Scirpophaga incertulas]
MVQKAPANRRGEYRIGLKFNEQHIPDSPFKVYISPAVGDAYLLEVAQFPDSAQVDKPAQFYVRFNGAKGQLDARVTSPSGKADDCFIQNIDGDQYSIRFMPHENGVHNINVKFNGVHIPASPLRIKVGKDDADPAAVHAHGPGLGQVKTGVKTDLIIDTCNAGAGILAVTMDGPSRVAMDCTEVEEGYMYTHPEFNCVVQILNVAHIVLLRSWNYVHFKYCQKSWSGVRFTTLITHCVAVKFVAHMERPSHYVTGCTACQIGGNLAEVGAQETSSVTVETVQKVSKQGQKQGPVLPHFKSDASKVQSKGMGLKKAYLNKHNQFTVHAGDAAPSLNHLSRLRTKVRTNYECWYVVRDRGDYIVIVKWGDDHIPGSPYKVEV